MAFNWQQGVEPGDTIDAEDLNEIKVNIDSIYSFLGRTRPGCSSGAGWSDIWPIQSRGKIPILASHFLELREKADDLYDNWCATHNSDYKSTHLSGNFSTYLSTHQQTVQSTHNATYRSTYNSIVLSTHYGTVNSGHDAYVV